ncbi:hypothetical protein BT69DRAFT_1256859 [Atractiella rhizophila]|nr:hypothetical protein BT69DRAFT_1256859 [Atractiella rhizophila]
MMDQHVDQIVADLAGNGPVTKRVEAITKLIDHLSNTPLDILHCYRDHKNLLEQLLRTIRDFRNAFYKPTKAGGPAAATRTRFIQSISALKIYTEKCQAIFNSGRVNSIVEHAQKVLQADGSVPDLYAKDYADILKNLWTYNANNGGGGHLDKLDAIGWEVLMGISWGAIFGKQDMERDEGLSDKEEWWLDLTSSKSPEVARTLKDPRSKSKKRVISDEDEDDYEIGVYSLPPPTKSSRPTQTQMSTQTQSSRGSTHTSVSPLVISFASVISILMTHLNAPIVENCDALASRFICFFSSFPKETSAHLHILIAFNDFLSEATMNNRKISSIVARKLYPLLLQLWHTKTLALKEQLIISLKKLWPFLTLLPKFVNVAQGMDRIVDPALSKPFGDFEDDSENDESRCRELLDTILADPQAKHCKIGELSFDCLRLGPNHERLEVYFGKGKGKEKWGEFERKPFETETVRFGNGFSKDHALTWTLMELGADCLMKLIQLEGFIGRGDESGSSLKRPRVQNPVEIILEDISDTSAPRANRLQLLLFLIERHWHSDSFPASLKHSITRTLFGLYATADASTLRWTLLCMASVGNFGLLDSQENRHDRTSASPARKNPNHDFQTLHSPTENWLYLWKFCLKKLSDPFLSRYAAHALNIFMLNGSLIEDAELQDSIDQLIGELQLQGPTFPSDSVCLFLTFCIEYATKNIRLYKVQCHQKIFGWLLNSWQHPLDWIQKSAWRVSGSSDIYFEPTNLLRLLAALSELNTIAIPREACLKPDCPVVAHAEEEAATAIPRGYLVEACLPEYRLRSASECSDGSTSNEDTFRHTNAEPPNDIQRSLSEYLRKMLAKCCNFDEDEIVDNTCMVNWTVDKLRRVVDLLVLALLFQAELASNNIQAVPALVVGCQNPASCLAEALRRPTSNFQEVAQLVGRFLPLFITAPPPINLFEGLLEPSLSSGIKRELVPVPAVEADNDRLQSHLWRIPGVIDAFQPLFSAFQSILTADPVHVRSQSTTLFLEDDHINSSSSNFEHILRLASIREIPRQLPMARLFCYAAIINSFNIRQNHQIWLVKVVESCKPNQILSFWQPLCDSFYSGRLKLKLHEAEEILAHFGKELFEPQGFNKSEEVKLLALEFVIAMMRSFWKELTDTKHSSLREEVFKFLGHRVKQLPKSTWRTRLRSAVLLQQYLELDPHEVLWEKYLAQLQKSSDVLLELLHDVDFRVRFKTTSAVGHVFSQFELNRTEESCDEFRMGVVTNLSEGENEAPEAQLVRLLTISNLMVAGTRGRSSCYNLILRVPSEFSVYIPFAECLLRGIVQRLGLNNLAHLHSLFVRDLGRDFYFDFRPPISLLGYSTEKEHLLTVLPYFGAKCYRARKLDRLDEMARTLGISSTAALQRCTPQIIATLILQAFKDHPTKAPESEPLRASIQKILPHEAHGQPPLPSQEIIENIVLAFHEQDCSRLGPLGVENHYFDKDSKDVMMRLIRQVQSQFVALSGIKLYEPETVYKALRWFLEEVKGNSGRVSSKKKNKVSGIMYDLFHELITSIAVLPFPHEQLQRISQILLLFATGFPMTGDAAILVQILRGFVCLLAQIDLFAFASAVFQSFLDFLAMKKIKQEIDTIQAFPLSDCLVAAAMVATQMQQSGNPDLFERSIEFEDALRGLLAKLATSADIRYFRVHARVTMALLPHLKIAEFDIKAEILHLVLRSKKKAHQLSSLVKFISDFRDSGRPSTEEIATLVWRLLVNLTAEDIDKKGSEDLANLIFSLNGAVRWPHLGDNFLRDIDASADSCRTARQISVNDQSLHFKVIERLALTLNSFDLSVIRTTVPILRNLLHISRDIKSVDQLPECKFLLRDEDRLLSTTRAPMEKNLTVLEKEEWLDLARDHTSWVTRISCLLADVCDAQKGCLFYSQLVPILEQDVAFAVDTLPYLVAQILLPSNDSGQQRKNAMSVYFRNIIDSRQSSPLSIRTVIDLVIYLRNFLLPNEDATAINFWLNIDYMILARGAFRCQDYPAALMFLELGAELDNLFSDNPRRYEAEEVFFEVYAHLDEPDGLYGIQSSDILQSLKRSYLHEGLNLQAFELFGADLEVASKHQSSRGKASDGVIHSLSAGGFSRLARMFLDATGTIESDRKSSISPGKTYELAWRTQRWDLPVTTGMERLPQVALYTTIRALYRERDPKIARDHATNGVMQAVIALSSLSTTNPNPDSEALVSLLCLRNILVWTATIDTQPLEEMFPPLSETFRFPIAEQLLANQICFLDSRRQQEMKNSIGDEGDMTDLYVDLQRCSLIERSQLARRAADDQSAWNSILQAMQLNKSGSLNADLLNDVVKEFAEVLWLRGETVLALETLKQAKSSASTLARRGHWSAEAKMLSRADVRDQFFEPAIKLVANEEGTVRGHVYYQYACFADHQFQAISKSDEFMRLSEYDRIRNRASQNGSQTPSSSAQTRTHQRAPKDESLQAIAAKAKRVQNTDQQQLFQLQKELIHFRLTAIKMFAQTLSSCDGFDDCVYRFCSLWMEFGQDEDFNVSIREHFQQGGPPSQKFAVLSPQLTGRLTKGNGHGATFQKNLVSLLQRLALEHPFHVLYDLHALARREAEEGDAESRAKAAKGVIEYVQRDKSRVEQVGSLKKLLDFYEDVCPPPPKNVEWKKAKAKVETQISPETLRLVANSRVPIPTIPLPFDSRLEYGPSHAPLIRSYDPSFKIATGNSRPKIITSYGTDGTKRKELAKAGKNEDLRQDAVMEQVFDLVNVILSKDDRTRRRALRFRTYKVIPLSSTQGVIQFLENMRAFGDWLNDAHKRYHGGGRDIFNSARASLKDAKGEARMKAFQKLLEAIQPVFRHFFFETQRLPSAWFEMRLNYARSVAVTSMVGFLVGLGDRHTSNILIDNVRGEFVQIDLGIAFEAGKFLPEPEKVPFRLTREVVDGLGMTGVEGVFRRCSQETLRVLREKSAVLMTILEVFNYDPLQRWTANRAKLKAAQGIADGEEGDWLRVHEDGARAIALVREKLSTNLSVEYTVNQVIQEAINVQNLCDMFHGWQAYL